MASSTLVTVPRATCSDSKSDTPGVKGGVGWGGEGGGGVVLQYRSAESPTSTALAMRQSAHVPHTYVHVHGLVRRAIPYFLSAIINAPMQ